jgi:hypothetical protein
MKASSDVFLVPISAIAPLLALARCAGIAASRYYALSPLPESSGPAAAPIPDGGVAIGVAPVRLPEYLNRPQIVMRTGPNQLPWVVGWLVAGPAAVPRTLEPSTGSGGRLSRRPGVFPSKV